jgi:energy-coupling factor transport system ATP-binding protein
MLRLEDVTARAGQVPGAAPAAPLLQPTCLEIAPGESHLLLGANGSGKTTLIRILAGIRRPSSGRVLLDGLPLPVPGEGRGPWPDIAALFEEPDPQFVADTVEAEVAFGLESLGFQPETIRARTGEMLEAFGLSALAARAPHGLSAGEKSRTLLAAALAGRPRLLLLDQSTAHLDPGSRRAIESSLVREALAGGRAIVRTHQDAHAPHPGETLHVLQDGVLREAGSLTPRAVLELANTPFPLALRVTAWLSTQGWWEGPLVADAAAVAAALAGALSVEGAAGMRPRVGAAAGPETGVGAGAVDAGPAHGVGSARPGARRLTLEGVTWKPRDARTPVLAGADLEVDEGEVVALVGRSGSGKSTILRLACGLEQPSRGTVTRSAPAAPGTREVALALEHPERQLFARTVLEDVAALLWVEGVPEAARRRSASLALAEVGLDPERFGNRSPLSLSEGEKRRVALAGLLVEPPLLVLLDEPTAGLDPAGRRALVAAIRALKGRGRAVLLASHDLDFVGAVADRVLVLTRDGESPGGVLHTGPAGSVLSDDALLSRARLPSPDFAVLGRALRSAGLLAGASVRDSESLLLALERGSASLSGRAHSRVAT